MLKLCIVCSCKVPSSTKACSCGHVFSPESRRILGKRFSVYRVGKRRKSVLTELSERKHNSNVKSDLSPKEKKKTILLHTSPPQKKNGDTPVKRLQTIKKKTTKNHRQLQIMKEDPSDKSQSKCQIWMSTSPQKTLRLSLALAEINRRLCGQTMLWRMLSP